MKMVNGSFVKERESLSCCDWFSMKLHEMMFRIKTFFDSNTNFHYGQRIKSSALKAVLDTRYIPGWGGAARPLIP